MNDEMFRKINDSFKNDGSIGIDKIIETDKAWIFTRKEKDNVISYGNYAVVVFKDREREAFLLMPELRSEVGTPIRETNWNNKILL